MNILLTNDDGIYAQGLYSLYEVLKDDHELFVVAPDSERSAVGHAITLVDPLRVRSVNRNGSFFGLALSGTPADCVKLAVHELIKKPIDLVISGINQGANLGINVLYSGTVSAATEAAILGIRSAAISLDTYREPDFCFAAKFAKRLVAWLNKVDLSSGVAVNVNVPALPSDQILGVRVTRQGTSRFMEQFDKRVDPRGNIYYWQTSSETLAAHEGDDIDSIALKRGYITITPIHFDLTSYSTLNSLPTLQI
ncbi:MAG: 5'/3'-nucleotidase SurE [Thermodesulfobacteriota bacterium]|nr:5'/3'-nucleotidase SurE [Thermodesulfobacteriota bacterium]